MSHALSWLLLALAGVALGLVLVILCHGTWRKFDAARSRRRRRTLEPIVLAFAHGSQRSILPRLGQIASRRDRRALEAIILDHAQRMRGLARDRLALAFDELGLTQRGLAELHSRRWRRRAGAAQKLGMAGAGQATDQLIAALEDPVPEVQLCAAEALGAVGGAAAIRPLIQALMAPMRSSSARIAGILSRMGDEVVEELIVAFPVLTPEAQLTALGILERMRPLWVGSWLSERLGDRRADVRARACLALGAIPDPAAEPRLIAALSDGEWPVRALAAKALGRHCCPDAVAALTCALRDPESWVRANAADALRLIGPPGLAALEQALEDDDLLARQQAAAALEREGVLDREVDKLAQSLGSARAKAEALVCRVAAVGRVERLRELAAAHCDLRVRTSLRALLTGAASPPSETTP